MLGLVVVFGTVGCVGFITGSEPLSFAANETVVGDDALSSTEYREAGNRTMERTENVSAAGQERQAEITSHFVSYNRSVDASELDVDASDVDVNGSEIPDNASDGGLNESDLPNDGSFDSSEAAQFAVLSTPGASVAGTNVNPLASASPRALVKQFLDTGENADITFEGNRTVESLGEQRTVSTYRADSSGEDGGAMRLHVTTFEYDGDVIVAVAGHPAALDEGDRIDQLIAGLEQRD